MHRSACASPTPAHGTVEDLTEPFRSSLVTRLSEGTSSTLVLLESKSRMPPSADEIKQLGSSVWLHSQAGPGLLLLSHPPTPPKWWREKGEKMSSGLMGNRKPFPFSSILCKSHQSHTGLSPDFQIFWAQLECSGLFWLITVESTKRMGTVWQR